MKRLFSALATLGALLLAGCTISPVVHSSSFGSSSPEKGYVLLSLGPAGHYPDVIHYNVIVRKVPNGTQSSILFTKGTLFASETQVDFADGNLPGALYHIALPAGRYEVLGYRVSRPNSFSPDISIPFTVEPGRTTYLGRFRVGLAWKNSSPSAFGELADRREDDLAIARRRFSQELATSPVVQ
jgi:hypothetical protein